MWLLVPLIVIVPNVQVAMAIGAAHGLARAIGILHNIAAADDGTQPGSWGSFHNWRKLDGVLLVAISLTFLIVLERGLAT